MPSLPPSPPPTGPEPGAVPTPAAPLPSAAPRPSAPAPGSAWSSPGQAGTTLAPPRPAPPVPPPVRTNRLVAAVVAPAHLRVADRRWLVAALAVGAFGASILVPQPLSLAFPLLASAALAVGVAAARAARPSREELVTSYVLAALAMGLAIVPALSRSPGPVALAVLGSAGLAGAALVPPRTWPATLLLPAVLALRGFQAVPWASAGLRVLLPRRAAGGGRGGGGAPSASGAVEPAATGRRPAAVGVVVTAVLVLVVGSLLISADDGLSWAMGRVLDRLADLVPEWSVPDVAGRIVLALVLASGLLVAVHARLAGAPDLPPLPLRRRDARTWGPPLVALAVMIGAFLAMQAVTASGHDLIGRRGGPSYADRVHQGFGQLLVVSMIVVGVVAWAARLCDRDQPGQRRLLALAAGPVVALTLGLAGVALGRLFGYEEAYGFTRMRLLVGGFELWLAAVLVLIAGAWFAPVARRLPVIVIASAGLAVLGIGLVGTDASVGRLNVDRYERTGKLDLTYLSGLSADVVPALDRLPRHERECAIATWVAAQPVGWTDSAHAGVAWNLGVDRAEAVVRKQTSVVPPCDDVIHEPDWATD